LTVEIREDRCQLEPFKNPDSQTPPDRREYGYHYPRFDLSQ
jgi:hypothetical protein